MINNIRHRRPLPVYGKGENVRDWLYVIDHARAIDVISTKEKSMKRTTSVVSTSGKTSTSFALWCARWIVCWDVQKAKTSISSPLSPTGAGHDLRYAIDSMKLKEELGWEPSLQFEEGIEKTVRWYLDNEEWMDNITSANTKSTTNKCTLSDSFF